MAPNIALCGLLRSGKDSVGNYLCERYGYTRFAFGDELKRYAHELFDVSAGAKPRELYQWFGQTMRQRDPELWVRKCFTEIERRAYARERVNEEAGEVVYEPLRVVISDIRQLNEYERCRSEGYVIIRVSAPDGVRVQRAIDANDTFSYADLTHETEQHVKDFAVDYEIENGGSLAELYARIDEVMTMINKGDV